MMPKLGLDLCTKVNVKTRLETLYYFIYEMAQSFGVDDDALESITRGILKRRVLSEIKINYKDCYNVIVGRVTIKIDWDKHTLLASTDNGASFTLDPEKSVRSQISEASDIIIEHVNNMKRALKVEKTDTTFVYIPEIRNDTIKHQEARDYMGHIVSEDEKLSIQKEFVSSIEWLCGKLKEVQISTQNS